MTVEPEGTPRWVKVSAVVAFLVIMLVVALLALGGHGPGRHTGVGDATSGLRLTP
jgi:hypothetical protein